MVELYDGRTQEDWIKELEASREFNVRHLLALFAMFGVPESMLDVGCGDGTMVKTARKLGVIAYGLDQLVKKDDFELEDIYQFHHNLVNKFKLLVRVKMVLCLETAEHLHESAHATLCETLVENLELGRGNFLIFSAAYPGQGGNGHLSERPAQYWHKEFSLRSMNFRKDLSSQLALLWSNINSPLFQLASNVMVFEK